MIISESFHPYNKLHAHHPVIKSAFVLGTIILIFLSHSRLFYGILSGIYVLTTPYIARIAMGKLIKIYAIPLSFILVSALTLTLRLRWLSGHLQADFPPEHVHTAIQTGLRSIAMVTVIFFWLLTNSISEISRFFYIIKLPALFVELFVLTYKYIFYAMNLSTQLYKAQMSRLAYQKRKHTFQSLGWLFQTVFTQSLALSVRNTQSLSARNGGDKIRFMHIRYQPVQRTVWGYAGTFLILVTLFIICR